MTDSKKYRGHLRLCKEANIYKQADHGHAVFKHV